MHKENVEHRAVVLIEDLDTIAVALSLAFVVALSRGRRDRKRRAEVLTSSPRVVAVAGCLVRVHWMLLLVARSLSQSQCPHTRRHKVAVSSCVRVGARAGT